MKLLLVVIDGMGDLPTPKLGGKTPLEYANKPNIDALAKCGQTGIMYTVKKGIAPESHSGVISILGLDPFTFTASRGVLEAVGAGMKFKDGDLALRCNFVTLGKGMDIDDRRAGRDLTTEEARLLGEEINKKIKIESFPADFEFRSTVGYRGILVIRSKKAPLSENITGTDPAYTMEGGVTIAKSGFEMVVQESKPLDKTEFAKISATIVNEFTQKSHEVMEMSEVNKKRTAAGKLKANCLLMRDAGNQIPKFPNINKKFGLRFASLVNMPVEKGIAQLTGMEGIEIPLPSEDLAKDCKLKLHKLLEHLKDYDAFYVHIKDPDEPGHDGDCEKKARLFGVIDENFFGNLRKKMDLNNVILCITADHATPCVAKCHTDDPVPILITGDKVGADGSKGFSENLCRKGSLGTLKRGVDLMPRLVAMMKK
ncbi:alkaline phosphatase family protein [Candidatus Bathyarchaeota archaeon]|nr:alkaline phosphatase family protein [Candidatus Bathyarchaeota archaeon]